MPDQSDRMPYYPWYVQDYRASRRVQRLSWKARGLYREILDHCWLHGSVPDDMNQLADICGCDIKDIAEHWRYIKPLLSEVPHSDSHLFQSDRMERERGLIHMKAEQARSAAKARWSNRKGLDADALRSHESALPPDHTRPNQTTPAGSARALSKPLNCTCEATRDYAPGTGAVFLRHAEDCPAR